MAPSSASAREDYSSVPGLQCEPAQPQFTHHESALLVMLKQHAGTCLTRAALLDVLWGYCEGTKTRTLDAHICRLRKKLGRDGRMRIKTVFRRGYMWDSSAID